MSEFVSVMFCRVCSSRYVDISEWTEEGNAVIRCRTCGNHEEMGRFVMGRCRVSPRELQDARDTRAKKGTYEK